MKKFKVQDWWLPIYKAIYYLGLLILYMLTLSKVNYALLRLTRTSVMTIFVYFFGLIVMQSVYGGLKIGKEKSKPIILTNSLSLFFVNTLSTLVLYIMGINEFGYKGIILDYLLYFILVCFVQVVFIYIMVYLGNYLFFEFNDPENVILIYDSSIDYESVKNNILSYDKQYRLVNEYNIENFKDIKYDGIDRIFLITEDSIVEREHIAKICLEKNISLVYKATLFDVSIVESRHHVIDDILMIELAAHEMTFIQKFLKRLMDIVIALIALLITIPVTFIVGIFIKLEDGGPVFFMQERLTQDGKVFKIIKFRSMRQNSGDKPASVDDDRITKTGAFIRKYRIDELPQFINVLKGDMSVVGPRPESISQARKILKDLPEFNQRLKVKGGLTGYAQIFGKYNTSPKQKLILDLKYIHNYSVFEDIKLIFQTLIVFFKKDSTEGFE